jgi:hypothetical protein
MKLKNVSVAKPLVDSQGRQLHELTDLQRLLALFRKPYEHKYYTRAIVMISVETTPFQLGHVSCYNFLLRVQTFP